MGGATEITLKPQSENGQETKVPGPTRELNLPWMRHNLSFSVSFYKLANRHFKDVILVVLVLKCVTMYQQQQQYYHLTGLAIYRQCCHKTNTTVYKNNR